MTEQITPAEIPEEEAVTPPTAEELLLHKNYMRLYEIDKRIAALEQKSHRPARAVALAAGTGEAPDPDDLSRLADYEAEIAALREERGGLA